MNKSEKSFYIIIENKKCGKFSGESPIQVAKKVASKKLKSGKKMEITFHLDEVGGKKKRYGPYQGRKDKKTGKVVVVKGGKIMKGGVLSANDLNKLHAAFSKNCNIILDQGQQLSQINQKRIINIQLGFISKKPLIFFNPIGNEYKYAVFEDTNGNIWIFFKNNQNNVLYKNFFEFFLNPEIISQKIVFLTRDQLREVLDNLINVGNNPIPSELKRIINEATKISNILFPESTKSIIYFPNYSESKIKKCVYPDLTFGISNEKSLYNEEIIQPLSLYQRFLIRRQPFFGGFSEPVIFLRIPSSNTVDPKFDLYISKKNGELMLKMINDSSNTECVFSSIAQTYLLKIKNIAEYCRILISIPSEFGNFKTVRNTANILLQQSFALQQPQQTLALQQPQQQFALQQQQQPFALQQQPLAPQYLNNKMKKIRLQQISLAERNNQQKIQIQNELLQNLFNLKQELERLKRGQNRLNRPPSVLPKPVFSLLTNPY
jgi:hypothetical protein